jgi:hypothetical protein
MHWYFLRQSCLFARLWFPTTPSRVVAAVVAVTEAEAVVDVSMLAVVDATTLDVLGQAIRSPVVQAVRVIPLPAVQAVRAIPLPAMPDIR